MRIIFFDTETTGNTKNDYLCQLAIKERGVENPIINELFKPPVPIPLECTMIHHISNKKVENKSSFKESPFYKKIKSLFEDQNTIAVAHNADFDEQMLRNEDINIANKICTFKNIREIDVNGDFSMHKLQYLRYALDIELDVPSHDALADVLVLEKVFEWELKKIMKEKNINENEAINSMIETSKKPITFLKFDFGKYKGKTVKEVAQIDPGYLNWLLEQKKNSQTDETDWINTLEQYVK